jgi:hypothetical protein
VIVAIGASVWAAKRQTSTVPIVIAFSGDPVGTAMVSNLARPVGTSPACRSCRATWLPSGSSC